MSEPYTIRVFVPDGDPEGPKIVELLNWTGVGVAFPRSSWPQMSKREEFKRSGVYILSGSEEGKSEDLPSIYVGQGEETYNRIESHYKHKEFWNWGYAFVSNGNTLNRAHITWLEYALVDLAATANRCHMTNGNSPREPSLTESEKADTNGFLREMLRILPLLGVHVFEKPQPVIVSKSDPLSESKRTNNLNIKDTVVVPAKEDGFNEVFLGKNCWYSIRIGGGMLKKIRYIAAYQTSPTSAVTHYAPVDRIEPYGDEGKYRLIFSEAATALPNPVVYGDAPTGSMQGPRYTNLSKLLASKKVEDFFM